MFSYITIENDFNGLSAFQLNASLREGKYSEVSFSIIDVQTGRTEEYWDNELYLTEVLLPWLRGEIEEERLENLLSNFKDEILLMFEEGIRLKLFTSTINQE